MRFLILLMLAGCAAPGVHPSEADGFAWQGKIGEGAKVFGSPAASHAAFLNDAEGCDWLGLRQPVEQREGLFLQCMELRGWLPVKLPR